ncbi:MAG: hypothetical protein IJL74_00640 [Bacilli bacterium]|nr:hypothetical protein [Bacilli bacterium]
MDKENCFAYIDKTTCGALIKKDCENCSFYKNKKVEDDPTTKYLIQKTKEEIKEKESK